MFTAMYQRASISLFLLLLISCSQSVAVHNNNKGPVQTAQSCGDAWCDKVQDIIKEPEKVSADTMQQDMGTGVSKWFYGKGLGVTTANLGAVFAFPPYAFYLLGNAGLQLAGYEPLYITDALPGKARDNVLVVYDTVTAMPGHVTAAFAGAKYYEPENRSEPSGIETFDELKQ